MCKRINFNDIGHSISTYPQYLLQYCNYGIEAVLIALLTLNLIGCSKDMEYPGYVEAEYLQISSSQAGRLLTRPVRKGDWVESEQLLFTLESENEYYQQQEAMHQLQASESQYSDLVKPNKRPDEIKDLQAKHDQARILFDLREIEFNRQTKLFAIGGTSQDQLDIAKSNYEDSKQQILSLDAQLHLAHLGAREDQIQAADHNTQAAADILNQAKWKLKQKTVVAPIRARVHDTLYRVGEWVNAGMPVIVLLPPENIKARFFVPEKDLSRIQVGRSVSLICDSCEKPIYAKISFVSQQAEFNLPTIFSRDSRSKLVFMVEARIPPGTTPELNPGQPLEIHYDINKQ